MKLKLTMLNGIRNYSETTDTAIFIGILVALIGFLGAMWFIV